MINTNSLIDADAIKNLVQQQVDDIVKAEVSKILQNTNDLVETVKHDAVQSLIRELSLSIVDLKRIIAKETNDLLSQRINSKEVNDIIKTYLRDPIESELDELIAKEVNLENILNGQVVSLFSSKLMQRFENTDIIPLIEKEVAQCFDNYVVNTPSIALSADQLELSVMDDIVVVENELATSDCRVVNDLTVGNKLTVDGEIDITTNAWQSVKQDLMDTVVGQFTNQATEKLSKSVITHLKAGNVDFSEATFQGKKLLTEDNIKDISELSQLKVNGEADINDTLFVANKRIGVNTNQPAMGLSVWDEEINILAGKLKDKTGYVGSANQQQLSIGVNRREDININSDGVVKINKFQVGQNRVRYESTLPGYKGTKGDITFNTNISEQNPVFAWVCLSGHNWLPLKAVV